MINVVAQVLYDGALLYFWGPKALAYMFISLMFSVGLHPLGARWIQEHYIVFPGQETADYYGPLNPFALNVGYHNEHHDFPSIPWNRLPAIKRAAPEAYDTLHYHPSWSKLLWRFIVDPEISLYTRYVREGPTGGSRLEEARAASQELPEPTADRTMRPSATQQSGLAPAGLYGISCTWNMKAESLAGEPSARWRCVRE